jgi:hypothetical protein
LFFLGGSQKAVLVRIQAQNSILYSFLLFVISEYLGVNSGPISAPEVHREQDFRVFHVIPFDKATNESKNHGFPDAATCNFNPLSGAHQA